MPVTRCPKCEIPLTQAEAQGATCPSCQGALAPVGQPNKQGTDKQAGFSGTEFALALVGAIIGGVIGIIAFGPNTWGTSISAGVGFAAGTFLGILLSKKS
jgi:hypothetical protein